MTETTIHPRQAEAQAKAAEVAQVRKSQREIIDMAMMQGVRFVEVDPMNGSMNLDIKPPKSGRLTVAYREDRRNIVMISTAICHPNDKFDKRTGRAIAAANMIADRYILLRKPSSFGGSIKRWIKHTFAQYGE
jgi:hypothetical protein